MARTAASEPRYAWVMVTVGTTLVALNFGALATISVFLKPVARAPGPHPAAPDG